MTSGQGCKMFRGGSSEYLYFLQNWRLHLKGIHLYFLSLASIILYQNAFEWNLWTVSFWDFWGNVIFQCLKHWAHNLILGNTFKQLECFKISFTGQGGFVAQRKHSFFPPSSPEFESRLHQDFFSLLLSLCTVLRSNPSSDKQWCRWELSATKNLS